MGLKSFFKKVKSYFDSANIDDSCCGGDCKEEPKVEPKVEQMVEKPYPEHPYKDTPTKVIEERLAEVAEKKEETKVMVTAKEIKEKSRKPVTKKEVITKETKPPVKKSPKKK